MSEFVALGQHATVQKGKPPASETGYSGRDAQPYLSPDYLRGNAGVEQVKPSSDSVLAQDGETILLWDGSNAGEFFKAKSGIVASTMARIKPDQTFSPAYFFHAAKQSERRLKDKTSGTGIPHVDREVLETALVFRPQPVQQAKIAQVLDTLDVAIAQTEAIIAKLKAVKRGLLHDLLTRGIDANGELRPIQSEAPNRYKPSALGWIPHEWEVELLDEVTVRGSGHTPSKSSPSYWNGGIKWVSLADSHRLDDIYIYETDKEISALGLANSSAVLHPAGTVILSRDAGIGKSAVLASEMAVSQHFIAWRCGQRVNNHYLYFWLQHEKRHFESIAFGSTILTIGLPFFKGYKVIVPPRAEQDKSAEILMNAEANLASESKGLDKLINFKIGLMDDLLTGNVRVTSLVG